jgi:hypothetical protein
MSSKKTAEVIKQICMSAESDNPIEILQTMMNDPVINIHGPEHHIMVGSALIAAYKNAGGEIDVKAALDEMQKRGEAYPGGSCGYWGCCGAAVSAGMFLSIVNGTTPLSSQMWGEGNIAVSKALYAIGEIGGPRCCKRNSFTAIISTVKYINETLAVKIKLPEKILCIYSEKNQQCKKDKCQYNKENANFGKSLLA